MIPASPCTRIRLPKAERRVVEPLPAAAIAALHEAITPRYRIMVVLGAGLGLREGEAFGLTVPRVDFLRRRVHIREQAHGGQLAPLKTEASRRMIPADDWVLSTVTAHLQRYGPGPSRVVVTNVAGRIAQRNSFGECWRAAVKAAGLPPGTRYHDLRHFYASALIAAAAPLWTAAHRHRWLSRQRGERLAVLPPLARWRPGWCAALALPGGDVHDADAVNVQVIRSLGVVPGTTLCWADEAWDGWGAR